MIIQTREAGVGATKCMTNDIDVMENFHIVAAHTDGGDGSEALETPKTVT